MPADPTVVCERCGQEFACGAATGSCWCREVALNARTLRRIAVRHADCLCHRCVADYQRAASSFAGPAGPD